MKNIGRKLVFSFGEHTIAIEIYPNDQSRYKVSESAGLLFDIFDFCDEYIERFVGESACYPYGHDLNDHAPAKSPMAWMTQAEADRQSDE